MGQPLPKSTGNLDWPHQQPLASLGGCAAALGRREWFSRMLKKSGLQCGSQRRGATCHSAAAYGVPHRLQLVHLLYYCYYSHDSQSRHRWLPSPFAAFYSVLKGGLTKVQAGRASFPSSCHLFPLQYQANAAHSCGYKSHADTQFTDTHSLSVARWPVPAASYCLSCFASRKSKNASSLLRVHCCTRMIMADRQCYL